MVDNKTHSWIVWPLLVAAILFALTGCDSNTATDTSGSADLQSLEVQDLYNAVTSEIGMTAQQQGRFAQACAQQDGRNRTPGYLWIVADSLAHTLSADQIDALLSHTGPMEGTGVFRGLAGFPGGGGFYGLGGFMGGSARFGDSPLDQALNLTDEQTQAIHAIRDTFRVHVEALRRSHHNGELTNEEFIRSLMSLHASLKEDIANVLTDEQKAIIERYRTQRGANILAFRDSVNAVRDEVLGLTPTESDEFDAILQDHLDAREVLLEQFQSGEIDLATLQSEIDALNAAKDEALQALLTEDQYLVVQVHDALAVRMGRRGHREGPNGSDRPMGPNGNGSPMGRNGQNGGG